MQINRFVCVIFFVVNFDTYTSLDSVYKPTFEIAVLLPLTEILPGVDDHCSNKLRPDALQAVEAFYYALDLAEKDEELTQNFTLKIHIVENCGLPISDMLHFSRLLEELFKKNTTTITPRTESSNFQNDTSLSQLIAVIYSNEFTQLEYDRIFSMIPAFPYISFSGPAKQIFNPNELRSNVISVSSGHIFIINVIFKILAHHNWKHVLFVAPDDVGDKGSFWTYVNGLAAVDNVCISRNLTMNVVREMAEHNNYHRDHPDEYLREHIPSYDTLNVIICYCSRHDIILLQAALNLARKNARKLLVIAGNADGDEYWRTIEWESKLGDLFYVTPTLQYNEEFYAYYTSLTVKNDTKHEYLKTFRKRFFECPVDRKEWDPPCFETYKETYKNNSQASNIIKSVHLVAHLIKYVLYTETFERPLLPKILLKSTTGKLRRYLPHFSNRVNFKVFDKEVMFTDRGLPKTEKFDVYKAQGTKNESSNKFIKVAEYLKYGDSDDTYYYVPLFEIEGNLTVLSDSFYEPTIYVNNSTCSLPCSPGHIKKTRIDQCCWECEPCDILKISNEDGTLCEDCEPGFIPHEERQMCIPVPIRIPNEWYDGQNLISMCFSSCSIILAVIISIVFVKYRNTPVVKSTTKELCYVMFAGIILANSAVFISVLSRNFKTSVGKVLPAIGFTMIYSALLMKTNRIARIMPKSKNAFPNINPKLVSITAQIIFTIALIGLETLICWQSAQANETKQIVEQNGVNLFLIKHYLNGFFLMKIYGFVVALVLLCVYFAIKMRHLPGNYNETSYIASAMYATIPTSLFFGLIYLISEYKILAVNLAISINSLIVLIFLFLPKVNIIFRRPEQNTKAYFATITPNIRKHHGNDAVEELKQ